MGKLSDVAVDLGTSVAKSILKLWLEDSEIAQDVSITITEILGKKIKDIKPRRPAQRFFERIADEVADSIEPMLEIEYRNVTDLEKGAALTAAIHTFDNVSYGDKVLFQNDLNPLLLEKHLKKNFNLDSYELSQSSINLYEGILTEACNLVVEITSTLPSFALKSTQEMLGRETILLNKLQEIVENIPAHSYQASNGSSKFETLYRRRVARFLDTLQIFGITSEPLFTRYKLSVAYISLSLVGKTKDTKDFEGGYEFEEFDELEEGSNGILEGKAEELLSESNHVLIRGEAGSGKTTLLQWLAVNCAKKTLPSSMFEWNDKVPFFIKLREYSSKNLPLPNQLGGNLIAPIFEEMPSGWIQGLMRDGSALVLLDGVDEVNKDQRADLFEWLKDLITEFPKAKFVLTSRPSSVEVASYSKLGFDCFDLEPMSREDQISFIQHWHLAIIDSHGEDSKNESIQSTCDDLISLFKINNPIRSLSTNPLLCAITCALNLERNKVLPTVRSELYRVALESLVDRRDAERFGERADLLELTYPIKEYMLRNLAFWMMQEVKVDASISDVEGRISQITSLMPTVNYDSKDVCAFLIERSGVLRSPSIGRLDFIHKTFQEYLAAKHIANEDLTTLLIEKAGNDYWTEVIILFTSLANTKQCDSLLNGLLESMGSKINPKLVVLAASAANEARTLSPEVSAKISSFLSEVIPPKTSDDARRLASAGDLTVPYLLKNSDHKDERIKTWCIRTLALISSSDSLNALKSFSVHPLSEEVKQELIFSWRRFDQEEYAREVLSQACIENLTIQPNFTPTLDGYNYLTSLTTLDLSGDSELYDISNLSECKELCEINFSGCISVSNFEPISRLRNLKKLLISDCISINDYNFLENLTSLEYLTLDRCKNFTTLSFLSKLQNLKVLSLIGCYDIVDVSHISNLKNLVSLNLGGCYGLRDLSFIKYCKKLESLIVVDQFVLDRIDESYRNKAGLTIDFG